MGVSAAYWSAVETRTRRTSKPRRRSNLELHLGRLFASGLSLEVRFGYEFIAEEADDQYRWKTVPAGIERLGCLIEPLSLNGNAILGSLELRLKVAEVGGRFELRIVFGDDQQVREGRRQPLLRLLIASEGYWIFGDVCHRGGRDLADLGARLRNRCHGALLKVCSAFDGRHQVGHQIGAPLICVLDLGPLCLRGLIELH